MGERRARLSEKRALAENKKKKKKALKVGKISFFLIFKETQPAMEPNIVKRRLVN